MIISLIGYRATGKTTVGCLLADRLGWTCVDTDEEIQQLAGKSIRQIFAEDGEDRFRDYETRVIQQLTRRHKLVLALGGGAILRAENRHAICLAGPVIWLSAATDTIQRRLAADPHTTAQRPSLTGSSPLDEVERVLQQRIPWYTECADRRIETDQLSPREIVDAILSELGLAEAARNG